MGRADLEEFFAEIEKDFNPRIEYPLLLAVLGVKGLSSAPWRQMSLAAALKGFESKTGDKFDRHILAYEWANFLAIRYAQLFRSGHITNYILAALAVLIALAGLVFPHLKPVLVAGEIGR